LRGIALFTAHWSWGIVPSTIVTPHKIKFRFRFLNLEYNKFNIL
jgi:hypothetical protein